MNNNKQVVEIKWNNKKKYSLQKKVKRGKYDNKGTYFLPMGRFNLNI